ncbi:hypothetical protein GPECTOR_100g15 [Gonium pectorale]|uniref:J domain-containing protein n=1 Tax=Gonium pectorale TaxID=33097 RepID=A0A150FZT9_GONPE|nr:hypothetical protein GPECTOR_100g15 [Gonium pectorale]|eukprot:KXZ43143.1 hypothetical protein GPECTOR_100g15 [Gonium pectorale]
MSASAPKQRQLRSLTSELTVSVDDVWSDGLHDQLHAPHDHASTFDRQGGSVPASPMPGSQSRSHSHAHASPSGSGSSGFSSSILAQSPEDALSSMFDQRVALLVGTLEGLRGKCSAMEEQLTESGAACTSYAARLARSEEAARRLRVETDLARERERQLQQDVARLEALLEASKLQASFSEARYAATLAEERSRSERLRAMRDDALQQATLADSALYVRYLRKRLLELELAAARQQQERQQEKGASRAAGADAGAKDAAGPGVFSLASIRAAITAAVAEAAACGEEERRRRVRQLQLRWHPDKNPVLTEFATEVTKMINEAVAAMEAAGGQSGGDGGGGRRVRGAALEAAG